jgi:hypothetical protein
MLVGSEYEQPWAIFGSKDPHSDFRVAARPLCSFF